MLYFILLIMMILGFIDGIVKLTSPSQKTRTESSNILEFLLSNK
jgi:cbb3-type cytochrome oxidase subunit 3